MIIWEKEIAAYCLNLSRRRESGMKKVSVIIPMYNSENISDSVWIPYSGRHFKDIIIGSIRRVWGHPTSTC